MRGGSSEEAVPTPPKTTFTRSRHLMIGVIISHHATLTILLSLLEHDDVLNDDLRAVAFAFGLSALPTSSFQIALDVDEIAFANVLVADLSELRPGHDLVELGRVVLLIIASHPLTICRDAKGGNRLIALGHLQRGIASEISDDDDFIDASHNR